MPSDAGKARRLRRVWLSLAGALLLGVGLGICGSQTAYAVEPDEMLKNPVLEHRAREISEGLRCLVCQNESIDDSEAPLARDLRLLVRRQILEGKTDKQIVDYIVSRYGEFVLLKPRFVPHNYILWFATPAMLLLGIAMIFFGYRHRKRSQKPDQPLTAAEKRQLKKMLEQA